MAFKSFSVTLEGLSPLLLSNVQSSDPLSEAFEQKRFFIDKAKHNKDDHIGLRTLDWLYSAYWHHYGTCHLDEENNKVFFEGFSQPTLPADNFKRCLKEAATGWKLGKNVKRALMVFNEPFIEYDGPKNANDLFNSTSPRFHRTFFVKRGVWVKRIAFPQWSVNYKLTVNDELITESQLKKIIDRSGLTEGLGTWRPKYGRFEVTGIEKISNDEALLA